MAEMLLAASGMSWHGFTQDSPSSVVLIGGNPGCKSLALPGQTVSALDAALNLTAAGRGVSIGKWQFKCEEECEVFCKASFMGDESALGDGDCDLFCNTTACSFDAGECLANT